MLRLDLFLTLNVVYVFLLYFSCGGLMEIDRKRQKYLYNKLEDALEFIVRNSNSQTPADIFVTTINSDCYNIFYMLNREK